MRFFLPLAALVSLIALGACTDTADVFPLNAAAHGLCQPADHRMVRHLRKTAGAASSDELLDLADRIGGAPAGGLQLRMPS
jgi:hypothetical protein